MTYKNLLHALGVTALASALLVFASGVFTTTVHASGILDNFNVTTTSHTAGATATYTFSYTTATDLPLGSLIFRPSFPVGFDLSATTITDVSVTLNGSPETVTEYWNGGAAQNGGGLLYVRVGDDIPAGTPVVVILSGVGNPSSAGAYTVPFETADSGAGVIDVPASEATIPIVSFDGGDGSHAKPYQISTCDQLQAMQYGRSDNYILENNIDCRGTEISDSNDPNYDISLYNSGAGFTPIGDDNNRFKGDLNGAQHVIFNLHVSGSGNLGTGIFGAVDTTGTVENIGIQYSSMSANGGYGGILIGQNYGTVQDAFVSDSTSNGSLNNFIGGLIGVNRGEVSDVYTAKGSVSGSSYIGGLTGFNTGNITDAYSSMDVSAPGGMSGGLVGRLFGGSLTNIFAAGVVTGSSQNGGLTGTNENGATTTNGYWSSQVSGVTSCHSNDDNTGCTNITDNENNVSYFYSNESQPLASWGNFSAHWQLNTNTYPTLVWEGSKIISTVPANSASNTNLSPSFSIVFDHAVTDDNSGQNIKIVKVSDGSIVATIGVGSINVTIDGETDTVRFTLNAPLSPATLYAVEIDPNAFVDSNSHQVTAISMPTIWQFTTGAFAGGVGIPENPYQVDSCAAFEAINNNLSASYLLTKDLDCSGDGNSLMVTGSFTGTFNGDGHSINMNLFDPQGSNRGLFNTLSGATVKNLILNGSVSNGSIGGALAGTADSGAYIKNVESNVSVSSANGPTGGLVGILNHSSLIADSYVSSLGSVNGGGGYAVGGLVGSLFYGASINHSYATESVSGGTDVGGLVGKGDTEAGIISNSFAAGSVQGTNQLGGLMGEKVDATLVNDYFDAGASGLGQICASDAVSGCTAEDLEGGAIPWYFDNNSTHAPLDTWDFASVWAVGNQSGQTPVLRLPTLGPVAYWPLDSIDQNGVTPDMIDNQHPAQNSEGESVVGNFNRALSFDNGAHAASTLRSSPSGTISLWAYPTTGGDWESPAGWKSLNPGGGMILLDEGSGGHWRAVFNPDLSHEVDVVDSNPISFNQWNYLTMTWSLDTDTNTYTIHLYVNGVDQGSNTWTGVPGTSGYGGFNIGKSGDNNDNPFSGGVDEVKVFDYPLDPSQITTLAQQAPSPASTPPATLSAPISGTYSDTDPIAFTFELPTDMYTGTLELVLTPAHGDPVIIHLRDADSGKQNTFQIRPAVSLSTVHEVISSSADTIPDGTYMAQIFYRDAEQDPVSGSNKISDIVIITPPTTTTTSIHSVGASSGYLAPWSANSTSTTPSSKSSSAQSSVIFTHILKFKMTDSLVIELQKFLNRNGFPVSKVGGGSPGHEINYFGLKTKTALIKFQKAHHIKPASGILGPLTQAAINVLIQQGK